MTQNNKPDSIKATVLAKLPLGRFKKFDRLEGKWVVIWRYIDSPAMNRFSGRQSAFSLENGEYLTEWNIE